MWHLVLSHGYDLLAVDLDWDFADIHGVVLRPASVLLPALRSARSAQTNNPADVVADVDLFAGKSYFLNVGLMWVRSTPSTISLVRRCEARSFGGWEQGVFNEEINWGDSADNITCCYAKHELCNLRLHLRKVEVFHRAIEPK